MQYGGYDRYAVDRVTKEVFDFNNFCIDIKGTNRRFLSTCLLFRSQNALYCEAVKAADRMR